MLGPTPTGRVASPQHKFLSRGSGGRWREIGVSHGGVWQEPSSGPLTASSPGERGEGWGPLLWKQAQLLWLHPHDLVTSLRPPHRPGLTIALGVRLPSESWFGAQSVLGMQHLGPEPVGSGTHGEEARRMPWFPGLAESWEEWG